MNFRERLLTIRKRLKLTQAQFAEPLGVNRGYISTLETSDTEPSESLLKLISYEYCISYTWLKTGEGEILIPTEEILRKVLERSGRLAFQQAAARLIGIGERVAEEGAQYMARRLYDQEPELKRMIDTLYLLWACGDERLKAWASIQFDRAIPADVVEDAQKKRKESTQRDEAS